MKKRNVMTMALSLAMVGVIGVGGTLAYLTATDGAVTNTFSFVQGDPENPNQVITVDLKEEKPAPIADEQIDGDKESGWAYTDVVPGQTLNKKPEVSVTTKVGAYVFVKITQGNVTVDKMNDTWNELENVEGVYYKEVEKADGAQNLGALFDTVTVLQTDDMTIELNNIKIEVAAIQSASFKDANDAYTNGNVDDMFQPVQ